jgi:hypothetical protein
MPLVFFVLGCLFGVSPSWMLDTLRQGKPKKKTLPLYL